MTPKRPAGFAFYIVLASVLASILALGAGPAAGPALAQDQAPRQSDAAPPTADTPAGAAPRILTPPPATGEAAPDAPRAQPAPNPAARFQFVRVGDTVLKLDGDSGAVGVCKAGHAGWACQVLPEDRLALDQEIGRLQQQVGRLEGTVDPLTSEVAALKQEIGSVKAGMAGLKSESGELKDGIASLTSGMAALRDEVGAVKRALPPPSPPPSERPAVDLRMPTAEDYARVRTVAAEAILDAWRRLVEMIAQVQSDVLRKS
jgi:hypothetical protein